MCRPSDLIIFALCISHLQIRASIYTFFGMESAGLRRRENLAQEQLSLQHEASKVEPINLDTEPPRYIIDLSLPPSQRYSHLAEDFQWCTGSLPSLFDEVMETLHPRIPINLIRGIARLFLRRLHSKEETEEIRGIHEATGIEMHLLVAFNVLLDILMGCTSGGVRVKDGPGKLKMLHFRTLDWGMDALRKLIVHLDFAECPGGPVIALTVTYFGYVGVLTGVRKGLSISLNFRPTHDVSARFANFRFHLHHVLVLLGFRPSISAVLRHCLLPSNPTASNTTSSTAFSDGHLLYSLADIWRSVPDKPSTAAYLTFSDGTRTITMEKDNGSAVVKSAEDFIVIANHDVADEADPAGGPEKTPTTLKYVKVAGMEDLIEESFDRRKCISKLWAGAAAMQTATKARDDATSSQLAVDPETLKEWMDVYPITNEETHFSCVMDPEAGEILWIKQYLQPIEPMDGTESEEDPS